MIFQTILWLFWSSEYSITVSFAKPGCTNCGQAAAPACLYFLLQKYQSLSMVVGSPDRTYWSITFTTTCMSLNQVYRNTNCIAKLTKYVYAPQRFYKEVIVCRVSVLSISCLQDDHLPSQDEGKSSLYFLTLKVMLTQSVGKAGWSTGMIKQAHVRQHNYIGHSHHKYDYNTCNGRNHCKPKLLSAHVCAEQQVHDSHSCPSILH